MSLSLLQRFKNNYRRNKKSRFRGMLLVIPKGLLVPLMQNSRTRYVGLSQKASTFGGHFLFFMNLTEASFSGSLKQKIPLSRDAFSDPEGTQTPNLLIRSQMLYSVKLRDLFQIANIKKST